MATGDYTLTGRVRDERHQVVEGLAVLAFARTPRILMRHDASLGASTTAPDGSFEMAFSSVAFEGWLEKEPDVYIEIRDGKGNPLLATASRKNGTGRIDFQIELGTVQGDPGQPDIYSGGVERMISELRSAGDFADISRDDVNVVLNLLLRTLGSYAFFADQLFELSGYDGIQVPAQPRREDHHHVTRWDEAVLP